MMWNQTRLSEVVSASVVWVARDRMKIVGSAEIIADFDPWAESVALKREARDTRVHTFTITYAN